MKLTTIALLALLGAMGMIFLYAPEEANQGIVQKIFYIHVACALTMYIGIFIAFLSGLMYLLERKVFWDEFGVAGAEVGFFFCTVVLLTGPIWAKPIWGAWWTWDPRLTTTLLLWLMYAGYLVLRGYLADSPRKGTISAVVAIVAALDVPLIHFSIRLWRGIHPSVMSSKEGGMPFEMRLTLALTFLATVVFFALLFRLRFRLERHRNQITNLRLALQETT